MSVNAIGAIPRPDQQQGKSRAPAQAPAETPFSQQVDAQTSRAAGTHGRHHHVGSQSITSSVAGAASAAGRAPVSNVASSILNLLS